MLTILLAVALPAASRMTARALPARAPSIPPVRLSPSLQGAAPVLMPAAVPAPLAAAPAAAPADAPKAAPLPALAPVRAAVSALADAAAREATPLSAAPILDALFEGAPERDRPLFRLSAPADAPAPRLDPPKKAPLGRRALKQVPNLITGLNLTSGLAAVVAATDGSYAAAVLLIILAAVFDMLDGRVARAVKADGPMGLQLDSLADVVSFGAAPALLAYEAALGGWGLFGAGLAAAFAFAGAYRLARFNLGAAKPAPALPDSFTGLPIPGGAGVVAAAVLLAPALPAGLGVLAVGAATAVAAAAMVSRLPYPALKKAGRGTLLRVGGAGLAAAGALAALGLAAWIPAAAFGAYLLTGPLRRARRS